RLLQRARHIPSRQQRLDQSEPRQEAAAARRQPRRQRARRIPRAAGRDQRLGLLDRVDLAHDNRQRPLLSTTTPSRSFTWARNESVPPSAQISVTMVSPGNTGLEKRTSNWVMRSGWYWATVERMARQAVP